MCSQYTQKFDPGDIQKIESDFDLTESSTEQPGFSDYVFPHTPSTVIVGQKRVTMSYSLVPSWSKERRPKFATYNCRIETAIEKPTWKDSFVKHHCIVPLSSFIEPIYEGELGGNMVGFSTGQVLYAAGIYNEWIDKNTGEVVPTFAILTKEPNETILKAGHDRSPIFLNTVKARAWIQNENDDPENLRNFLLQNAESYDNYHFQPLRKLKKAK